MTWLEETYSSSLILSFEFELVLIADDDQGVSLDFEEPSIFISNVETRLMRKGTKIWTSFVSPKRLNTKHPACAGDEPDGFFPLVIWKKGT